MERLMLIGKTGVGKTSLIQAINKESLKYKKTQAMEFYEGIVDTPGEYIENKRFYNAIVSMSYDVTIIGLVQDAESGHSYFPPGFAKMFNKKVIGIITKIDSNAADVSKAKKILNSAGAEVIYRVSALDNIGIDDIKRLLAR